MAALPSMRAWSRWLWSRPFWIGWFAAAGVIGAIVDPLIHGGGPWGVLGVALALAVSSVFWLVFVPQRVRVGRDGIAFRWMGTDRVISWGEVDRLEREGTQQGRRHGRSWLVLRDGPRVRIAPTPGRGGVGRAGEIERAIEERLAAFRTAGREAPVDLARGGRDDAAWLARLREIAASHEGFREGALDRDALLEIVESPSADPTERAAAARILRSGLRDPERARVRVAAEETVAPKVRVALEEAAEADDDARVERALARLR